MKEFSPEELHFFHYLGSFPIVFRRYSICYLHQPPLETQFNIWNSEKDFPVGTSTAPVINKRDTKGWGRENWIFINHKISLISLLPSNLLLIPHPPPPSFRWFLVHWFNQLHPNAGTFKHESISKAITLSPKLPSLLPQLWISFYVHMGVYAIPGWYFPLQPKVASSHTKPISPVLCLASLCG